jgi:multidrug efflux pump subunit AcrB
MMDSILQLYGLAMVVLPVYAFVSLRKKIRHEGMPKRSALIRYAGIVFTPILGYAVAFGLALGVEAVSPFSLISEEVARSFVLAVVLGVLIWLLAITIFVSGLILIRGARKPKLLQQ